MNATCPGLEAQPTYPKHEQLSDFAMLQTPATLLSHNAAVRSDPSSLRCN
jgi:hypothetical protein